MGKKLPFKEFAKCDFRIAKILRAEDIEGKDKLYKIEIDLGELGKRAMLSGIKKEYSKEELAGKSIAVITNLEPLRIGNLVSEAMLLAAKTTEGKYTLLTVEGNVKPGTKVE